MLSSRVSIPSPPEPSQEDIFSSSLSQLFTDDTQNSHGTPGQGVVYHSPRYGDIELGIPQHPDVEEGRKLFAHYLWNAGIVAADAIENASNNAATQHGQIQWDRKYWDVRGKDILELGAGTALPSLISALSGARSITITDHPSSPALTTGTIAQNVRRNIKPSSSSNAHTPTFTIAGLTWGANPFTSPTHSGELADPQPSQHSFDSIIIADCLWMPSQHRNLVSTINIWLRDPNQSTEVGKIPSPPSALIIAGFHTGRSTVSSFFDIATGVHNPTDANINIEGGTEPSPPLSLAEIFEVDVDLNVRDWVTERPGETKEQTKRWCVCAVLVKKL